MRRASIAMEEVQPRQRAASYLMAKDVRTTGARRSKRDARPHSRDERARSRYHPGSLPLVEEEPSAERHHAPAPVNGGRPSGSTGPPSKWEDVRPEAREGSSRPGCLPPHTERGSLMARTDATRLRRSSYGAVKQRQRRHVNRFTLVAGVMMLGLSALFAGCSGDTDEPGPQHATPETPTPVSVTPSVVTTPRRRRRSSG
jgi:hypothetical protein